MTWLARLLGGLAERMPAARDARLAEREAALAERAKALRKQVGELAARAADAVASGDEERAEALREDRLRRRLELEDVEAAGERVQDARAELAPEVARDEAEEAAESAWRALARARAAAGELEEALEAAIQGPAARLVQAYRSAADASSRALELERELAEEHGMDVEIDRPRRVDHKLREAEPRGMRGLEALRRYDASRNWPEPT